MLGRPRLDIRAVVAGARWVTEVLRAMESIVGSARSSSKERGCVVPFPLSDLDPNRAPLFLPSNLLTPSVISSVARHSRLFLTLVSTLVSDTDCFQVHQVPAILRNRQLLPPGIPNELEVYKPSSKVVPTSPRLHPSSTLKSSFTIHLSV